MFKKYATIKKRLMKELGCLCYRMGIPATEEPKICWNREQYKWYTGNKPDRKRLLGQANKKLNTILVDLDRHKEHGYGFQEIRNTLIHELVHVRWHKQPHSHKFRQLIKRNDKGEIFALRTQEDIVFREL